MSSDEEVIGAGFICLIVGVLHLSGVLYETRSLEAPAVRARGAVHT